MELSSALRTCASCFLTLLPSPQGAAALLLCALVQVASAEIIPSMPGRIASALRTCASCFDISFGCGTTLSASALRTCASCFPLGSFSSLYPLLLLCALVQVASSIKLAVKGFAILLLCALVQVASAKLHSSLRQAVEAICIGAQLHIISKCELPFNSTIDSNDMIVRRANLSWQQ